MRLIDEKFNNDSDDDDDYNYGGDDVDTVKNDVFLVADDRKCLYGRKVRCFC